MNTPRSVKGGRYHQFGEHAYAVALDDKGGEVSERHAGTLWLALSPDATQGGHVIFVDEHGGRTSTFTLTRYARSVEVWVFVDDERTISIAPIAGATGKGATIAIDWGEAYDYML